MKTSIWTIVIVVAICPAPAAERQAVPPGQGATLRIGYLYDAGRHGDLNRAKRNYWDVYIREILDQLGARAAAVGPALFQDAKRLAEYATILVGDVAAKDLSPQARQNLERWVQGGGTLIAFATDGLHELCGNRARGRITQPGDEFTCAATFAFKDHHLTSDIHTPLQPQQRLLIFADVQQVQPEKSIELARLFDRDGKDTGCAAVTMRELGRGRAFYFAFNVPQTIWVLHQGRPVDRDYDGDGYLRRSDAIVIRPHHIEVAYADEILFLVQNMIGTRPHALVHQLPPMPPSPGKKAGEIPDALFFWGGDDEGSIAGIQVNASNWMKEHGLPYHINAMPRKDGTFGLRPEEAERIRANGHEISLHYNFIDNFPRRVGFTRDDVLAQAAAFKKQFGGPAICTVNHWTRWTGWTEPAKWMRDAGGKAENTFVHAPSPPGNPVNLMGFSFGTAFPFWFYDDYRDANKKIDFLEQPIVAYECGYIGKKQTDFAMYRKVIDTAVRYRLTMNMFHHPIYITDYPSCRETIVEGLRYMKEKKIRPLHMGNDALYRWWKARSETRLSPVTLAGQTLSFTVEASYPAGVIVKVPLGKGKAEAVTINGAAGNVHNEVLFGQNWAMAIVPRGKNMVTFRVQHEYR